MIDEVDFVFRRLPPLFRTPGPQERVDAVEPELDHAVEVSAARVSRNVDRPALHQTLHAGDLRTDGSVNVAPISEELVRREIANVERVRGEVRRAGWFN